MAAPERQIFELRSGKRGLYAYIGDKYLGRVTVMGDNVLIYSNMAHAIQEVVIPELNEPEDTPEDVGGVIST